MTWGEVVKQGYDQFVKRNEDLEYVVRCKDCKYTKSDEFLFDTNHCVLLGRAVSEDDYCAWGMRKEVEDE